MTGTSAALQVAVVPFGHQATLYGWWGDWFAAASALALLFVLGRLGMLVARQRSPRSSGVATSRHFRSSPVTRA